MPSPFPGMDPWLEHPDVFPDLHDRFITYLSDGLNAALPAPYFANTTTRIWVEVSGRAIGPDVKVLRPSERRQTFDSGGGLAVADEVATKPIVIRVPHDEFREPLVEIRTRDGHHLVTTIEILSLTNKRPGEQGRDLYRQKQQEILESQVNLVEIDLLRGGDHSTAVAHEWLQAKVGAFDYHVCVHRWDQWQEFTVYARQLPKALPTIEVPLLPEDAPVTIALQPLLDRWYDLGRCERWIPYRQRGPVPPLTEEQAAWAEKVLREKGL